MSKNANGFLSRLRGLKAHVHASRLDDFDELYTRAKRLTLELDLAVMEMQQMTSRGPKDDTGKTTDAP